MRNLSSSCKFCPESHQKIRECINSCSVPMELLIRLENERKIKEDKEKEQEEL